MEKLAMTDNKQFTLALYSIKGFGSMHLPLPTIIIMVIIHDTEIREWLDT